MAINFLNSVDFNKNELLNPTIENQPNDTAAGTGVEGQLYFNTTDDILKVYANGAWVEVGGGVTSLTTTDGTYIDLTPNSATTGAVTVTADLSAVDGTAGAGERYLTKSNTWATVASIPGTYTFNVTADGGTPETINSGDTLDIAGGTYITTAVGATDTITINHDSTSRTDTTSTDAPGYGGTFEAVTSVTTNATGHVTAIDVSTVTMPSAENYSWTLNGDSGTPQQIASGNTAFFIGGTNISTSVSNIDNLTINLEDNITLAGTLTVNGTGQSSFAGDIAMGSNSITGLADPTNAQDAATKAYVDAATVGGLVYQGGYNASTNTPDLTTSPNSIEKGWTYTVTADGTFFGEQLRVGDVLIAEVDDPSALADWTTVQNNIDLASASQIGIGNVAADTGLDVTYSSGTGTVGLDFNSLSVADGDHFILLKSGDNIVVRQTAANIYADANEANTFATTITDTATITHSLDTKDVIIQLYDVTTDETVYADVERVSVNTATITFASTPTNDIRVLVQKIG